MTASHQQALDSVKTHLRAGGVYRRADFEQWSNAPDRHLRQLVQQGRLQKLAGGLYYAPKLTDFGTLPADDKLLVKAFLKDERFLLYSPNAYNALGVGTTQLYNTSVVYNHKRHGQFTFGNRTFDFRLKPYFPLKLSSEFLLVDLVNNVNRLAEDTVELLERVKEKATQMDRYTLLSMVKKYGGARARKLFMPVLETHA